MTLVFSQSMNLSGSTCPGRLQETLMHGLSQMAPCLSGFGKSSYFGIVETGHCASSSCGWLSGKGRGEPSPPSSTVSHTGQHTLSTTQLAAGFTRSPEGICPCPCQARTFALCPPPKSEAGHMLGQNCLNTQTPSPSKVSPRSL